MKKGLLYLISLVLIITFLTSCGSSATQTTQAPDGNILLSPSDEQLGSDSPETIDELGSENENESDTTGVIIGDVRYKGIAISQLFERHPEAEQSFRRIPLPRDL